MKNSTFIKLFLTIGMLSLFVETSCAQVYSWRQQISSNCRGLTTSTSCGNLPCNKQDLCWDTTVNATFTCSPASGSTCTSSSDWKAGGGGWIVNGTSLYPLTITNNVGIGTSTIPSGTILEVAGNMHIGANLVKCDSSSGCRIDSNNSGSTNVTISPTGVFTTAGGYIYSGANPYINATRATDKSSPSAGDLWYNSAYPAFVYSNGSILKRIPTEQTFSTTIAPVASTSTLLWKAPVNSRIETINCIVDPGGSSSAVINIQSCNSSGTSCASVDTSSITCVNTGTADDGSISSPAVTSGSWVNLSVGALTNSPTKLTVTVKYSLQP